MGEEGFTVSRDLSLAADIALESGPLSHLLASAIYDSGFTSRLQEHPEDLEEYLKRANDLRHHMRVLGIDVAQLSSAAQVQGKGPGMTPNPPALPPKEGA